MRKICFEDAALPLWGDVVYPITVFRDEWEYRIAVSADMRGMAEAFFADPPAEECLGERLLALFSPVMREKGYVPLPMAEEAIVLWRGMPVLHSSALPSFSAEALPDLPWALTHRRADMPDSARFAVADGVVAAAAWYTEEGIAVETAPLFRRRGLARALVAQLTASRHAQGREVFYRCRRTNAASMALAASLDFVEIGCEYRLGFRRMPR